MLHTQTFTKYKYSKRINYLAARWPVVMVQVCNVYIHKHLLEIFISKHVNYLAARWPVVVVQVCNVYMHKHLLNR